MSKALQQFKENIEGYVDLNMVEEAAAECLKLVAAYPDDRELLLYSAGTVSLGTPEQIKHMVSALARYLGVHPDAQRIRESYAVLLSLDGRTLESLAQFALVPPELLRHNAHWVWFKTLLGSGDKERVRKWIAETWPKYSARVRGDDLHEYLKFLWDVSAFLMTDGRLEEAATGYQSLLEHDPRLLGAYLDYGRLLVKLGRLTEARTVFNRGLALTDAQIDEQGCYAGGIVGYYLPERRAIMAEIKTELQRL